MTSPFSRIGARRRAAGLPEDRLPPGQYIPRGWPVLHYGRVPTVSLDSWDFRVFGATADGRDRRWTWSEASALARTDLQGDFHCVTKFSLLDNTWAGIAPQVFLDLVPPATGVNHVMVWGEFGYSSNLHLDDLRSGLFATHRNGEPLTAEHGAPMRLVVPQLYAWKGPKWVRGVEYLTADRRGFWEERGYHNRADPWLEQRYSYQEQPGDGPEF